MTRDAHRIPVTILICDGDAIHRGLLQQALDAARVANVLQFVGDGDECLDYLYQRGAFAGERGLAPRPGLILLDLDLPGMEGGGVLDVITGDATLRDIPVVGLTTSRREDNARGDQLGVRALITKPVTFAALLDAIDGLGRFWLEIVEEV